MTTQRLLDAIRNPLSRIASSSLLLLLMAFAVPAGAQTTDYTVEDDGNWTGNDAFWTTGQFISPGVLELSRAAGMNQSNPTGSGDSISQNFTAVHGVGVAPLLADGLYTACFGMGNQSNYPFPTSLDIDFAGLSSGMAIASSAATPPSGGWSPWSFTWDGNDNQNASQSFSLVHTDPAVSNLQFDGMGDFTAKGSGGLLVSFYPGVSGSPPDQDGDGVFDPFDNCVGVSNPHQIDANDDGFGNACDVDFDDNLVVGIGDFGIIAQCFGKPVPGNGTWPHDPFCAESDTVGSSSGERDLVVGLPDFVKFAARFGNLIDVDDSGLCCAGGTIPCEAPAQIYAATDAGLAISSDGGSSWRTVTAGVNGFPNTDDVLAVDAQANRVVVGTDLGVAISEDSGQTWWVPFTPLPVGPIQDVEVAGKHIYVATSGGIAHSANRGIGGFNALRDLGFSGEFTSVSVFDQTIVAGTASGGIEVSKDHGSSWVSIYAATTGGSNSVRGVFANAENHGWLVASDGGVSSLPALASWNTVPVNGSYDVTSAHAETLFVFGTAGNGILVDNTNRTPLSTTPFSVTGEVRAVYSHREEVYAATSTGVKVSTDAGASWTTTTPATDGFPNTDDVRDVVYR